MKLNVKNLSLKAKTIISICAFAAIFLTLILVASFLDLEVSKFLTKGVLKSGSYHADDFLGVMFECIGSTPIYFVIAFALCVLFWSVIKLDSNMNNGVKTLLAVILGAGVAVAFWYALKDTMGYIFEHVIARSGYAYYEALDRMEHSAAIYGIEAVFGVIMATLAIFATKHFDAATLKKLLKFVLVTAVGLAVANILIMIIKDPVGRMRFRAINSDLGSALIAKGDLKGYTPWYISNGQPNEAVLNKFAETYHVTDAFKSFPSGHTCAAGSVYCVMLLPEMLDFDGKIESPVRRNIAKAACWVLPVLLTALVGVSRIMVGAHYLSDVTMGGTIAFLCIMISREIFVCKGSHFKCLFAKAGGDEPTIGEAADETALDAFDNADSSAEPETIENTDSSAEPETSEPADSASDDVGSEGSEPPVD